MMEAASWDDWSASNAAPITDDDKWHVALAPDEVKIVSLEQLDDLFRLSIVDAETKVWQEGMTEWQPLGVIAGIEDKPEPKRAHPKPPSPRSAPPPAPVRAVTPAPRSAPPRPATPAPRLAAPAPRSAPPPPRAATPAPHSAPPPPPPASRAPAPVDSFYAAPIDSAHAAPIALAPIRIVPQTLSLRPLVVTQAPRRTSQGGGFGRFVLGLAVVAGVGITLYRNGLVRDGASSLHQEALYARLETALGGPSFGTLRALERISSDRNPVSSLSSALAAAPATADERPSTASPIHDVSPASAPSANTTGNAPPVVALESLKPETTAGARAAVSQDAPSTAVKPAAQPKPQAARTSAAPAVAFKAVAQAKPAPKAAPVEKKPEPKNEGDMTPRERLNAAIGASMMSSPPTAKKGKAKAGSEYDPLNPKL
jgi:hypothetical protein